MDDRTLIIIFALINIAMWWLTIDFMIKTKHFLIEDSKRNKEFLLKYVNMSSEVFQHFMEQITDIMSNEGLNNASKNRQ